VVDQYTDFLSVGHFPKGISVSSLCMSANFLYEICQPMISLFHSSVQGNVVTSPTGDSSNAGEPFWVQNNITKVVSEAQNINVDSPIVVKTKSVSQISHINYEKELQGFVITVIFTQSGYYDIHTALFNTFANDCFSILVLEGYMMALVKQQIFLTFLIHMPET
jgi:hypothetical protein